MSTDAAKAAYILPWYVAVEMATDLSLIALLVCTWHAIWYCLSYDLIKNTGFVSYAYTYLQDYII